MHNHLVIPRVRNEAREGRRVNSTSEAVSLAEWGCSTERMPEKQKQDTMPKLKCPCGFIHDLSPIPDEGWITVRDKDYERLVETEVELHQTKFQGSDLHARHGELTRVVTELQGVLYQCPECGRIMWKPENSEQFRVYAPET